MPAISNAKLSLSMGVFKGYRLIGNPLIRIKSCFISWCSDIDRYLFHTIHMDVRDLLSVPTIHKDVRDQLSAESIAKLSTVLPIIGKLDESEVRELFSLFAAIRTNAAHIACNQKLYLNKGLKDKMLSMCQPLFDITCKGKKLTMFGQYYVLSFLSQAYQVHAIVHRLFRFDNFFDVDRKNLVQFHAKLQAQARKCCGKSNETYSQYDDDVKQKQMYLTQVVRPAVEKIFLTLEAECEPNRTASSYSPKFSKLSRSFKDELGDKELFRRVSWLRNQWFHRVCLGDAVGGYKGHPPIMEIEVVEEFLRDLKIALKRLGHYEETLASIAELGKSLLHFALSRWVELTYKLLETNLFLDSKFHDRVAKVNAAYQSAHEQGDAFYTLALDLASRNVGWKFQRDCFVDRKPRSIKVGNVRFLHLRCDHGFDIHGLHTDAQDLYLADGGNYELRETINGFSLEEIHFEADEPLCDAMYIFAATLN